MKRCALYVRVSTQEQKMHGISVDNQIDALEAFCKEQGYSVAGIYNDAGLSARKSYKSRPELMRMLGDCQRGKIDLVLFTKLDRFSRNVAGYYETIAKMHEVPWRAIWEDYETETPAGVFRVNIMLSVAQNEADNASARVKAVMQYKIAKGEYVGSGKANLGYMRRDKKIYIDESTREAVSAFFREYLNTFSTASARAVAYQYGLDISPKKAHFMLKAPIYAGKTQNCLVEPYITQEEHDLIVKSFDERRTRVNNANKSSHIFSGLLRCSECGHRLLVKKCNHGQSVWIYYKCDHSQTHRINYPEKKMEQFLLDELEPEFERYKLKTFSLNPKEAGDIDGEIKKLEARLKRVGIRFEDGDIDADEYRAKRDSINAEIEELKTKITPIKREIELPNTWRDMYMELDDNRKRAFWSNMFDHVDVSVDKEIKPRIIF